MKEACISRSVDWHPVEALRLFDALRCVKVKLGLVSASSGVGVVFVVVVVQMFAVYIKFRSPFKRFTACCWQRSINLMSHHVSIHQARGALLHLAPILREDARKFSSANNGGEALVMDVSGFGVPPVLSPTLQFLSSLSLSLFCSLQAAEMLVRFQNSPPTTITNRQFE